MATTHDNPFRIHGTVRGPYFTDRAKELAKFERALGQPGNKMLVYGHRRMGKTSTLENAVEAVNQKGGHAFLADLSTVTTIADMANRILAGATKAVGHHWTSFLGDFTKRFQAGLKLTPDPTTGLVVPSLEIGARQQPITTQQASLENVLDVLESLAAKRHVTLGLVLDEFQEINRLGGDQAEWHLRGVMQKHQHISYIAAGSKPTLLKAMVAKKRAFYELFDLYPFGPIERRELADWIDERIRGVGLVPSGAGELCVEFAGARTRDIIRLARKCVDRAQDGAAIGSSEVTAAFHEIIDEDDDATYSWWEGITRAQQNVLRAVAATSEGMTTKSVRTSFGLEGTGSVTNTLKALVTDGRLTRSKQGSRYAFDNPFVRGWIIVHALPDLGIQLSAMFIATPTGEYTTEHRID